LRLSLEAGWDLQLTQVLSGVCAACAPLKCLEPMQVTRPEDIQLV
jgi:hypothetical protein